MAANTTASAATGAVTTATTELSDLDPAITNLPPSDEAVHDCPLEPDGDLDDPNNLFTCLEAEECCTVDLMPACCAKKDATTEIMDQLQLWGPLLGVILFLALFIWWCRSDDSCCDVEKPFLYRCGCKKHAPRDVIDEEGGSGSLGSQVSVRSTKSSTTLLVTDDGTGHDPEELEEAADNLEAVLDNDPEAAGVEDGGGDEDEGGEEGKEEGEAEEEEEDEEKDEEETGGDDDA